MKTSLSVGLSLISVISRAWASGETAGVYKFLNCPGESLASSSFRSISEKDALLNLADDWGLSPLYNIEGDAEDYEAISLGKCAQRHSNSTVFVGVSGVEDLDAFLSDKTPLFTIDSAGKGSESFSELREFISDAPTALARLKSDVLKKRRLTAGITIDQPKTETDKFGSVYGQVKSAFKTLAGLFSLQQQQQPFGSSLSELRTAYSGYESVVDSLKGSDLAQDRSVVKQFMQLRYFASNDVQHIPCGSVVSINIDVLDQVLAKFGRSDNYNLALGIVSEALADLIESAKRNSAVDVVLVALPAAPSGDSQHEASGIFKREESTPKSACQATQEQCKEAFGSCSGHGTCTKVGKCWTCVCSATVKKGKTSYWKGNECEKEDISSQFNLLLWTTIFIVIAAIVGVKFLYECGEGRLPGILLAATTQTKKSQ